MWVALAIVVAVVAGALIYLASLSGRFRVRRSLEVDAPVEAAFAAVVDFKTWPEWSPWLMHEPDTRIEYSDNFASEGGYYTWDGKVVGAGKLTHVAIRPNGRIEQQIDFVRPFKSTNRVNWEFEPADGRTRVTWEMEGEMPFLFRFMTKRMEPMIGRDYDLGLALLNGYLNAEAPHPRLTFAGEEELEDFNYWAIPFSGNLRRLEAARKHDVETLQAAADGPTGLPLILYRNLDPLGAQFEAEIAIPIGEASPQSNYTRREFHGGRYFKMTLRGDHRFLPLAWYALCSHCRMHRIKRDKSRPDLEIYHDDPAEVGDGNEILTALYVAIR